MSFGRTNFPFSKKFTTRFTTQPKKDAEAVVIVTQPTVGTLVTDTSSVSALSTLIPMPAAPNGDDQQGMDLADIDITLQNPTVGIVTL